MIPPPHPTGSLSPNVGPDLLWRDLRIPAYGAQHPALILDRDGVMIEEKHHLCDPEQVVLLPGAAALISSAHSLGLPVVVVTNQAAIGYGKCDWESFRLVQARIEELLASEGAAVDAVFACPFHAVAQPPYGHPDHPWRKPNPGMLLEAAALLNLALDRSILVGDKVSDIAAARSAGLPAACLVRTGHGENHVAAALALAGPGFCVSVLDSLAPVVSLLPR